MNSFIEILAEKLSKQIRTTFKYAAGPMTQDLSNTIIEEIMSNNEPEIITVLAIHTNKEEALNDLEKTLTTLLSDTQYNMSFNIFLN